MHRHLSIFFLASQMLSAQVTKPDVQKNPISLLPDGSVMHGVLLPRYDSDRTLVGDLHAETLTLIDPEHIKGEDVLIRFFNPDRSLRAKAQLEVALFDSEKSLLRADEPVEITSDRLVANGTGLIYEFQNGQGFLIGPASTRIFSPPKRNFHENQPASHRSALRHVPRASHTPRRASGLRFERGNNSHRSRRLYHEAHGRCREPLCRRKSRHRTKSR